MALKGLNLEHFRGKESVSYAFGPGLNRITGKNGVGKSTIKEAICFVFCGTDSLGSRNPQHLISKGKTACKVVVTTDKAEIARTLTDKGNGTLRLTRDGVGTTLTQSQLETMLGSTDLFLSALLPGFFLTLSTERQHKVIAEVRPKVDRLALFKELGGFELTAEEQIRYQLSRRTDLVASQVATDRRDLEKQAAVKQGEAKQLSSLEPIPHPGEAPVGVEHLEDLKGQWDSFKSQLAQFTESTKRAEEIKTENAARAAKRAELQAKLDAVRIPEKSELKEIDLELIRQDLLREPAEPQQTQVVEEETCPTCSQTVGLKHRERIKGLNAQVLEKYQAELARVNAHNEGIQTRVKEGIEANKLTRAAYTAQLEEVRKAQALRQRLTIELEQCKDYLVPPITTEPKQPTEAFDEATYQEAKKKRDDHRAATAQFDYVQKQVDQAKGKLSVLNSDIEKLGGHSLRLSKIEEVLKLLPQEEMKRQASSFDIGHVKLEVGEEVSAVLNGTPYSLLSTGESMKAGSAVCRKIDSMMQRPLGMLFLDNADLVDTIDLQQVQAFLAEVTDHPEVQIQ